MRKRAFTLIELLVVIAIIAILAAILFPVFAQAKIAAKKTSTLSNFKQSALGFVMYATDHDDLYPKDHSFNTANGTERWNFQIRVPAGWQNDGVTNTPLRIQQDTNHWANSVQPYLKNLDILQQAGIATVAVGGVNYGQATRPRARVGLSFNGMLHAWPATAVGDVSKLTLVWAGLFKQNRDGFALTSPTLLCDSVTPFDPCSFRDGARPQATGGTNQNTGYGYVWWGFAAPGVTTSWVYNNGLHFVGTDTSARFVKVLLPNWPTRAMSNDHPWSAFDPVTTTPYLNGAPYWMIDCVAPNQAKGTAPYYYPGFFRPDSEFNYTEANCDIGND